MKVSQLEKFRNFVREHANTVPVPVFAKNVLQEYCQALQLGLPVYHTFEYDMLWYARVTVAQASGSRSCTSSGCVHKREAEACAAMQALELLLQDHTSQHIELPVRTVLLVDLENLPNFLEGLMHTYSNLTIVVFVGEKHALCNKVFPNTSRVAVPSTRADAVDTCIQVYTGWCMSHNLYDCYLIATQDHFGQALVDIIQQQTFMPDVIKSVARVVTQPSDI